MILNNKTKTYKHTSSFLNWDNEAQRNYIWPKLNTLINGSATILTHVSINVKSMLSDCFYGSAHSSQSWLLYNPSLLRQISPLLLGMFKTLRVYLSLGEEVGIEINYVDCHLLWFLGSRKPNLNNPSSGCLPLSLFYKKLDLTKRDVVKFPKPQEYKKNLMSERAREWAKWFFSTNIKNCLNLRIFTGNFG